MRHRGGRGAVLHYGELEGFGRINSLSLQRT